MPEITDVEGFKKYINSTSLHKKITSVEAPEPKLLRGCSRRRLKEELSGQSFSRASRHGKHLFLQTDKVFLRLHFGMTGYPLYRKSGGSPEDESPALGIGFDNGFNLLYFCRRKLGAVSLEKSVDDFVKKQKLGPDAASVTRGEFKEILAGRRGLLKTALMNQELIAGLGNILTDEIFFRAGVHPLARSGGGGRTADRLFKAMSETLSTGMREKAGETENGSLMTRRREGERCPVCGGRIKSLKIQGRGSFFCAGHQTPS